MPVIPVTELARRLCVRAHPYLATTSAAVPCGPHTQIARNLYGVVLSPDPGQLEEIIKARAEAGLPMPTKTRKTRKTKGIDAAPR